MALTAQQDIPKKKKVNEPWTFRRLFPFAGAISSLTKTFVNPLDILLGYLVFILGIAILFNREISWFSWIFTIIILAADLFERHKGILSDSKKEEKHE